MLPSISLMNKQFEIFFWPKYNGGSPGPPVDPIGTWNPFKSVPAVV